MFGISRMLLALLVAGIGAITFGVKHWTLASACQATPQVLTGMELQQQGWGNNANIELTKAATLKCWVSCTETTSSRRFQASTTKLSAFIPMISLESDYMKYLDKFYSVKANEDKDPEMPKEFCCILKLPDIKDDVDVERVAGLNRYNGVIINSIDSLSSDQKRLLREEFPGVNLSSVAILEYNRIPQSTAKGVSFVAGGGLAVLCAVAFLGMAWKNR